MGYKALIIIPYADKDEAVMIRYERLNLAVKFLREGEEYVAKGDPVQASEKLYKAAEESVKAMSSRLGLRPYVEALSKGRWTVSLLEDAVRELSGKVDKAIRAYWDVAYRLYVDGFHEARLRISDVEVRLEEIRRLVELAESLIIKEEVKGRVKGLESTKSAN